MPSQRSSGRPEAMDRTWRAAARDSAIMDGRATLRDPVCSMAVTQKSFHWADHQGKRLYFCGVRCKERFVTRPGKYLPAAGVPLARAATAHDRTTRHEAPASTWLRVAQSIKQRQPSLWTLIGLGSAAAFLYSVIASVMP